MEKPIGEKSPVAKMIDDLHEKFIRNQGGNGTFPKLEAGIKANKPPALGNKNPNERKGMKEEAGNYSEGGEVESPFMKAIHALIDSRGDTTQADNVDPVATSSGTAVNAVRGSKGGEVMGFSPGGEVPAPQSGPDFLAMMNNAPNGGMDVSGDTPAGPPTDEGPGPDATPSLGDTSAAINAAPDTNYDFYGNTGSDQRAALYKSLLDQQRSPGNLIAQGIGGIGDAFSALGGKSTDFQGQARGISTENTASRIGAMDTQRAQKLQDLQGNQEAQLADPKSPMSRSIIASARGAGMNVGSLMPGNMVLKMMGPMADFALKKATIDMTGEHYKAEEANYGAQRDLEGKRITATVANQNAERTQGAAKTLAGRGMFKKATDAIFGDPGTKVLEDQLSGGQPGQQAAPATPAGQPMTATNSMGHKITSTDGGQTWQ